MKHSLLLIAALFTLAASIRPEAANAMAEHGAGTRNTMWPANARGAAPANDACANAETIAVTTDCITPTVGDNTKPLRKMAAWPAAMNPAHDRAWYVLNPG